jgi:hypothetical protein
MHLLEAVEGSAKLRRHDLDVLCNVAVLASVRVLGFEDEDVPSVDAPPGFLTQRRERSLLS